MDHPALSSPQTSNHFSSIFVVIITLKVLAHSIGPIQSDMYLNTRKLKSVLRVGITYQIARFIGQCIRDYQTLGF